MSCIKIKDRKPIWKGDCTFCLACIHQCPQKAIQYNKKTEIRKRYQNPDFVKVKND